MELFGRNWDRSKISIVATLELVDVSKTTLYRDLKENKLSATTNARGKKVIDTAELEWFYGKLKSPPDMVAGHNVNSQSVPAEHNGTLVADFPTVIAVVADQVALLRIVLYTGFLARCFDIHNLFRAVFYGHTGKNRLAIRFWLLTTTDTIWGKGCLLATKVGF